MKSIGRFMISSMLISILNWALAIVIALCRIEQFYMIQITVGLIDYLLIKKISRETLRRRFIYIIIITIFNLYVGFVVLVSYDKVFNDEGIFSIFFLLADILFGMIITLLLTCGQIIFKSIKLRREIGHSNEE